MSKSNQSALASCVGIMGSSAFGACLRARIGSFLPALVAFAATPCDDIGQIIAAVIVANLGACSDVPDGAYDDLMAYRVDLGIGPARMICVTSKVLSARSVDRPTAVDLEEIAVASGLKFIGLLGRKLAAFVFDNESSLLDRRCRKKTQARAGTADTESSVAGHIRHVRRFAPVQPHRCRSAIDLSAINLLVRAGAEFDEAEAHSARFASIASHRRSSNANSLCSRQLHASM
jgi:hypothetical protein